MPGSWGSGIALWAVLAAAFGLAGGLRPYRLLRHGATTQAVVTAKEPDNHQLVHFRFVAAGAPVEAQGNGIVEFEALRVGDSVTIHYLPSAPTVARLRSPRTRRTCARR